MLGAHDRILSTSSLVLGVAASGASGSAVVTAGVSGLVAGAGSMAAGEYVSVNSQRDTEKADLRLEATKLAEDPEGELAELTAIYEARELRPELAVEVATKLTLRDALGAHARDELGLPEDRRARPLQAAGASALSFAAGAILPLLAIGLFGNSVRVVACVVVTIVALCGLGALGAWLAVVPRHVVHPGLLGGWRCRSPSTKEEPDEDSR